VLLEKFVVVEYWESSMLVRNSYYAISEVIEHVKVFGEDDDDFCIYGADEDRLSLDAKYFISGYPEVSGDKEIYPEPVRQEGLSYLYSGQQFVDVVTLLAGQKPDASYEDFLEALNYYQEHDEFIEL